MFKRNWPFITAASIVLLLAGFFYYLYLKSPTYNWFMTFNHNSSSPYGNELLYKVMDDLYPQHNFTTIEEPLVYNGKFKNTEHKNSIYFYSGYSFKPDKSTVSTLYDFINKGNQVFISANEISRFFLDSIIDIKQESDDFSENAIEQVQCTYFKPVLNHPYLKTKKQPLIKYKVYRAIVPMEVGYFSNDFFETFRLNEQGYDYYRIGHFELSKNKNYTNYIKIRVGKGWLHLYSSPLVFTNYYLRKAETFEYAQKVFLHLEPGDIFWHVNSYASQGANDDEINISESPFAVLLSFSSFRYAWYSFLGAIILFCIFSFKRKQRPIPVLEKNTNSSVEFAETITKLYLADGKHKNIAQQKFRYFFNFVRTKFGINLKANVEADKIKLANLSKVPIENIDKIMFSHTRMESLPDTTLDELNETVVLINEFYSKT